jgi:hypothetical protein
VLTKKCGILTLGNMKRERKRERENRVIHNCRQVHEIKSHGRCERHLFTRRR